ncbi:MAG: hypothetical protein NVS2B7_26400 [Herpetosiphon sp.]
MIISPNDPQAMSNYAAECTKLSIPYLYDPSMQAPRMTPEELRAGFAGARVLTGNEYEFGMMADKLGVSESELRTMVPVCVVTRGADGVSIFADGIEYNVPPATPRQVLDPTGAGDAFRAGLVKGMVNNLSWEISGRLANLAAVYAIEQAGTQQHFYTPTEFMTRYRETFGSDAVVEALFEKQTVSSF